MQTKAIYTTWEYGKGQEKLTYNKTLFSQNDQVPQLKVQLAGASEVTVSGRATFVMPDGSTVSTLHISNTNNMLVFNIPPVALIQIGEHSITVETSTDTFNFTIPIPIKYVVNSSANIDCSSAIPPSDVTYVTDILNVLQQQINIARDMLDEVNTAINTAKEIADGLVLKIVETGDTQQARLEEFTQAKIKEINDEGLKLEITQNAHGFTLNAVQYDKASGVYTKANVETGADAIAVRIDDNKFYLMTNGFIEIPTNAVDSNGIPYELDEYYFLDNDVSGGCTPKKPTHIFQALFCVVNKKGVKSALIEIGDPIDLNPRILVDEIDSLGLATTDQVVLSEPTIADLIASKKYKVGDVVQVLGYYSAGDGAGHQRQKKAIGYTGADAVIGADGSIWGIVHSGEVDVSWFGAKPIKEYDSTDIFIKLLGLDIKRITLGFKTYYLNLDLSDVVTNVRIDITDGFLKPFDRNVNKNYLLKMNNKANDFIFFPFRFKNVHLTGRENTNVDGEIDYIFYGVNTALLADDSIFSYAIKNNIYIKYGQYSKFNDCVFTCCVLDSEATSVVLDSNTSSSSANENIFMNCRFNTNRNHLKILGGISNKFYGNQFQYTTTGYAITLGADSTGFGANKCIFDSCYFEVNNKELKIGVGIGHSFVNNAFVDGIRGEVTFVQDYIFRDNQLYNGPNTLTITNSTQQTKRMIWEGNNFEANLIGMFNLDKLSSYSKPSTIGMNNWGDNIQRVETNTSITTSLEKVKIGAIPSGLKLNLVDLEISLISDSAASTTNSYFANSSYKYQLNINSNRVNIGEVYKYTQTSSFAEIKDVSITVESNEIFLNLTKSGTGVVGVIDKVICILNINEKFINKSIEWV